MMPSQSATYICSTASELQRSRDIQKQAERDYYKGQEEIKLLLLGAGESGKSTVFKQMKILYGAGFSADDKANFRTKVRRPTTRQGSARQGFKCILTPPLHPVHERLAPPDSSKCAHRYSGSVHCGDGLGFDRRDGRRCTRVDGRDSEHQRGPGRSLRGQRYWKQTQQPLERPGNSGSVGPPLGVPHHRVARRVL
mmetsp:Transcript_72369/g.205855  ORF Transcript_72369/g.205855 Transcript_72369/m.205855 type:complete len:195 (+) Transcript_72369:651-1235(+)